ncbi:MAG: hypothetical protein FJX70_07450 [Alphaproteobacteria bacterium]|nr:hypothetical protein [Alphaproteobacteria bacterium]
MKEEYLNIICGSISAKTTEIIQRRLKLLLNLKNRNQDKILFNQKNEWRTLGLGYNSKRVLEEDINFLERAKNILKTYEKNCLVLILIQDNSYLLQLEYLNSLITEEE